MRGAPRGGGVGEVMSCMSMDGGNEGKARNKEEGNREDVEDR